ncbi:MAG: TolC family outer membrane protein [Gammaproteobacteria bacterium]|nr:TolC family outer membrane protein [Gammaproteobacteria bacterium]
MKTNRTGCTFALICLLVVTSVQGQDLIEVYELALANDSKIREAQQRLESVRETKPQARALLLPSLSLSGDVNANRRDVRESVGATGLDSFGNYGLSINLLQPIYHRDYWIQLEQADSVIAQAEAEYAAAQLDLMARIVEAYFGVLAADDNLTVSEAQTKANQRQLEQAKQRFDVGLIAITDVHEAQAAFDGARANQIAAENEVDSAWEALFEIIGHQPEGKLAKLGEKLPLSRPTPEDMAEWADTAMQQNYAVVAARNAAEAQKQTIEIQRSGHFPTLDLVGGYGVDRTRQDFGTDVDTGVIGLQLNVPLYQGGAVSSRTRQAQYDYEAARESLDQQRRAVNRQVRDAYRGVISSISRVNALKATVVSSRSALESTQAGYDVGTRTLVDVLTVQSSMFDSTRNYLASRYNYIINGLLLKQAASTLTRQDLERVNAWLVD